jgi:hypothetical protein
LGTGTEQVWQKLLSGASGVGPITHFDATNFDCRIAAEIRDFDPLNWVAKKELKKMGRFIQVAVAATDFAMRMAQLEVTPEIADLTGVDVASGIGGFDVIEREHCKLLEGGSGRISFHPLGYHQPGVRHDLDSLRRARTQFSHGHGLLGVGPCGGRFFPPHPARRCRGDDLRRFRGRGDAHGHRRIRRYEGAFHAQ